MKYALLAMKAVYEKNLDEATKCQELGNKEMEKFINDSDEIFYISMNKLEEINKYMKEMNEYVDKYTEKFISNDTDDSEFIIHLDGIQTQLLTCQHLVNTIQNSFTDMYLLDYDYLSTIDDLETLSILVENMIKSNISYNAISLNIITAYSGDLGETINMKRGTGRLVFFPKNKNYVLKIPFNGFGVSGNKMEIKIWNIVKDRNNFEVEDDPKGLKLRFAEIQYHSKNSLIIEMENIEDQKKSAWEISRNTIDLLKEALKEQFTNLGYKNFYPGDLHYGNIFINNNSYVLIDYGMIWTERKLAQEN